MAALALATLAGCRDASDESKSFASVQQRVAAGDHAGALIELKALLQSRPDSAAARRLLGESLLAMGDGAGAEVELRRALDAGQPRDLVLPVLARALLAQRKADEVLRLADSQALADPSAAADLAVAVALAHQSRGQVALSLEVVAQALQRVPAHPGLLVAQARLWADQGDNERTVAASADLATRFPGIADVWLLRGDALSASRDPAAAAAYERALGVDPRLVEAHGALIESALARNDLPEARTRVQRLENALPGKGSTLYYQVLLTFTEGDVKKAREGTQQLLQLGGQNPLVLLLAGMVERRAGSLEQAHALLTKAVNLAPQNRQARQELASVLVAQGQGEQALAMLKPNLDAGQAAPAASWTVAAQAHTLAGDFKAADAAFSRARLLRPEDASVRIEKARSLLARGQSEQGVKELQQAGGGPEAALELINALTRARNWPAALEALDVLAREHPAAPLPELVRGRVHEARNDRVAARKAYEAALARNADYFPAMERLAQLDIAQNDEAAARRRYESHLQRQPRSVPSMLALADLVRQAGAPGAELQQWLDKAVAVDPADPRIWGAAIELERRTGVLESALARAERAAEALPENTDILLAWSELQKATGDTPKALATLNKAVALQPRSTPLRLALAQALADGGDLNGARQVVDRALAAEPRSLAAQRAHIVLLLRENKASQAVAAAQTRLQQGLSDSDSLLLLAEAQSAAGDSGGATATLRRSLSINERVDIAARLSEQLRRGNDAAAARAFEEDWLRRHPNDAQFVAQLAQQAEARGDKAAAIAHYRRVVALVPDAALALNNLAQLLVATQPAEALALAQRAVALAPNSPPLLDTLAQAQSATGELDRAISAQTAAVTGDPRSGALRLGLAKLYLRAGKKELAREQLLQAATRAVDLSSRTEAEKQLRELRL